MTLKRSNIRSRSRPTGPIPAVVEIVEFRDDDRCAWCGLGIRGTRGVDYSVHHRRPRRAGGDKRPETNRAANLVLLHGSATTSCHRAVESARAAARDKGLLLWATQLPAATPIHHAVHGLVLLDDLGGVTPCES